MEFVKAKTILSKVNYGNDWYGIDYNMNLYRGCPHKCIYCDSRSNCYHNKIEFYIIICFKEVYPNKIKWITLLFLCYN